MKTRSINPAFCIATWVSVVMLGMYLANEANLALYSFLGPATFARGRGCFTKPVQRPPLHRVICPLPLLNSQLYRCKKPGHLPLCTAYCCPMQCLLCWADMQNYWGIHGFTATVTERCSKMELS